MNHLVGGGNYAGISLKAPLGGNHVRKLLGQVHVGHLQGAALQGAGAVLAGDGNARFSGVLAPGKVAVAALDKALGVIKGGKVDAADDQVAKLGVAGVDGAVGADGDAGEVLDGLGAAHGAAGELEAAAAQAQVLGGYAGRRRPRGIRPGIGRCVGAVSTIVCADDGVIFGVGQGDGVVLVRPDVLVFQQDRPGGGHLAFLDLRRIGFSAHHRRNGQIFLKGVAHIRHRLFHRVGDGAGGRKLIPHGHKAEAAKHAGAHRHAALYIAEVIVHQLGTGQICKIGVHVQGKAPRGVLRALVGLGDGVVDGVGQVRHVGKDLVGIQADGNVARPVQDRLRPFVQGQVGGQGEVEVDVALLGGVAGGDGKGLAVDGPRVPAGLLANGGDAELNFIAAGGHAQGVARGAQDKVAVGIDEVARRVDVQHAGLGVKDVAVVIHDLQKALAGNGHVQGVARGGHGGLAHQQVHAGNGGAVAHRGGVDAAPVGGGRGGAADALVVHIAEGGAAGFKAVGIDVGNVVADDVHAGLVGLHARHTGIHRSDHNAKILLLCEPSGSLCQSGPK